MRPYKIRWQKNSKIQSVRDEVEAAIETAKKNGKVVIRESEPRFKILGPSFTCQWCGGHWLGCVSIGVGWAAPEAMVCSICGNSQTANRPKNRAFRKDWEDPYPYYRDTSEFRPYWWKNREP